MRPSPSRHALRADEAEPQHTFVFADLAGYTALTDVHGDVMAADLAEQFCRAVGAALPPGAEDLKSLGDACMIHVDTAGSAVEFALSLLESVSARLPFPAVRVGMHTGPAIARGGDWFGQTVNTAARIAELAGADEILVSDTTRRCAGERGRARYVDVGVHDLRNIRAPHRLFRASAAAGMSATTPCAIDPVCRLRVALHDAVTVDRQRPVRAFCSQRCADEFARDPLRYAIAAGGFPALRSLP